jgi:hypothetical protein
MLGILYFGSNSKGRSSRVMNFTGQKGADTIPRPGIFKGVDGEIRVREF